MLKATELMIGDLIYEGDHIHRVESLSEGCIDGMMEECYSGIPLTPEIFEKNFNNHTDSFSVFTIRKCNGRQTPIWIQITSSHAIKDAWIVRIEWIKMEPSYIRTRCASSTNSSIFSRMPIYTNWQKILKLNSYDQRRIQESTIHL